MFHLLLVNFSKVTSEKVQNICSQSADFVLYESNSLEKAVSFCKQIKIHCVLPVSYTHLDVYKRQVPPLH